jgi:hypothetical protein
MCWFGIRWDADVIADMYRPCNPEDPKGGGCDATPGTRNCAQRNMHDTVST